MLQPIETIKIYQTPPSPQTFSPGEVIFTEGEKGNAMYGVVSGEVEMYVDGKLVETIKEGDLFGEGALIHDDHKRASTAIAKTETVLAFLTKDLFLFAIQETPMFAIQVMRSYSNRFRRLKDLYREC
jgi:CRP-like cAMP-binding protein